MGRTPLLHLTATVRDTLTASGKLSEVMAAWQQQQLTDKAGSSHAAAAQGNVQKGSAGEAPDVEQQELAEELPTWKVRPPHAPRRVYSSPLELQCGAAETD